MKDILQSFAQGTLDPRTYQKAHADLLRVVQQNWKPLFHNIHKVKSHRKFEDACDPADLYTIMGNDLADTTAKQINKLDTPLLLTATQKKFEHSKRQLYVLSAIYRYLAELNALHSRLI